MTTLAATAQSLPSPQAGWILGHTFHLWRDPLDLFCRGMRCGPVTQFRFGPMSYLLINDVDGIHHVLIENPHNYIKGRSYEGLRHVLGNGLVTSEGDYWRHQRKIMAPTFHRESISAMADQMVDETTERLAQWQAHPEQTLDIHHQMMTLTFQIVGKTLFSRDFSAVAEQVKEVITVALDHATSYSRSALRLSPSIPTPANLRFRKALKALNQLVEKMIRERIANRGAKDLLELLLSTDDDPSQINNPRIRDELITMIGAGHETTANALTWTWHLLANHPEIQERVFDEATTVLSDRRPVIADLQSLVYTSQVVQESMRLYPPVWIIERQAIEADQILGYPIAPGQNIAICPFSLHRDPTYWEEPEQFDPDRFSAERSRNRPKHAFFPFSTGPRVCIGNHFAMTEAVLITAMIARQFRVETVSPSPVELLAGTTLRPKRQILLRIHRRDSSRDPILANISARMVT